MLLLVVALVLLAMPCVAQRHPSDQLQGSEAEVELQRAIQLTRKGQFQEAISHFLAVQGEVRDPYAANFNLAICYIGTRQFKLATERLLPLRASRDSAEVENLLAQSLIGEGRTVDALDAVQRFAKLAPKNEKLYLLAAEACMDNGQHELGLKVVELGLKSLPKSARLYFERGTLLSEMDQFDAARPDFKRTQELAPGSDVAYIAGAQDALYAGNMNEAMRIAREGIEKGNEHFLLLSIYGQAVLAAGIPPGQPAFADAQEALERAVSSHPNFASARVALGKVYMQADRTGDAIAQLEAARALDAKNPAVYSNLAAAYRKRGETQKAEQALATLAKLNQAQAEKIGSAPGERKAGYSSTPRTNPPN